MSVATIDLLNASLPCSRVSSMPRFSQNPKLEGDSGTTSFSPSPTQLQLPNSPDNTQLLTKQRKTPKNCSFLSETRKISEDFLGSETSLEEEPTIEEESTVVEINFENTEYSPPKSFAGTATQFTTQGQPSCFGDFTQKTTQGSHFTQFIKLKKPMFKQTQDVPFKLSPDYDHDKTQHRKKFKAVMKQLKSRRNRYYVYNPMMKNTHAWNSQTKNPKNDKNSETELSSQLESSQINSNQIQPPNHPKTPVSPFSEDLPLRDFDLETPTHETLKELVEGDARSTEFELFNTSNLHKTPDSSGFGDFLKTTSQKHNICPPTPPEEFKNTPNALRQTRLYHVMTQVKRKDPNDDEGKVRCGFQGDSVLYESYEEFLEKKPRYKAGNGLNKRIRKSLHFKFV